MARDRAILLGAFGLVLGMAQPVAAHAQTSPVATLPQLPPPPPEPLPPPSEPSTPSPAAEAAEAAEEIPPDPVPQRQWYGWQILLTDVASVTSFAVGMVKEKDGFVIAGIGGFVLAPVAVHAAHGNAPNAGRSILLRLGLPLFGGLVGGLGGADCERCDGDSMALGAAIGFGLGLALAPIIDIALAYDTIPSTPRAVIRRSSAIRLAPMVTPTNRGAAAGVMGVF